MGSSCEREIDAAHVRGGEPDAGTATHTYVSCALDVLPAPIRCLVTFGSEVNCQKSRIHQLLAMDAVAIFVYDRTAYLAHTLSAEEGNPHRLIAHCSS